MNQPWGDVGFVLYEKNKNSVLGCGRRVFRRGCSEEGVQRRVFRGGCGVGAKEGELVEGLGGKTGHVFGGGNRQTMVVTGG